jgi:hypothetical protein
MSYLHHVVYTRIGVCLKYESDFLTKVNEIDFKKYELWPLIEFYNLIAVCRGIILETYYTY